MSAAPLRLARGRTALVLDGGEGQALATVRSLGRAGWRVLAPAGTRSGASRHAAATVGVPEVDGEADRILFAVAAVLDAEPVDVIIPCTDASALLLHENPEILGRSAVLGGRRDQVLRLTDKVSGLLAAEASGFPVPMWGLPRTAGEAVELAAEIGYPCVVKPRRSYGVSGGRLSHRRHTVVGSPAEVRAAFVAAADEPPLVQAFVAGRALSVGAVRHEGRLLGWVARETLTFHPIAGGTSVWKRTVAPDLPGVQAALGLLESIDYEGLAEVEFQLQGDGTPRLMEIGVRAFAWLPLAMAAGADLALLAARALCGEDPQPLSGYRVGVEMRWPAGELLRLWDAARGLLPLGTSRRQVLRAAWPPWSPRMRYDGLLVDDWWPWAPARVRRYAPAIAPATAGAAYRAPSTNREAGPNRPSAANPTK